VEVTVTIWKQRSKFTSLGDRAMPVSTAGGGGSRAPYKYPEYVDLSRALAVGQRRDEANMENEWRRYAAKQEKEKAKKKQEQDAKNAQEGIKNNFLKQVGEAPMERRKLMMIAGRMAIPAIKNMGEKAYKEAHTLAMAMPDDTSARRKAENDMYSGEASSEQMGRSRELLGKGTKERDLTAESNKMYTNMSRDNYGQVPTEDRMREHLDARDRLGSIYSERYGGGRTLNNTGSREVPREPAASPRPISARSNEMTGEEDPKLTQHLRTQRITALKEMLKDPRYKQKAEEELRKLGAM